MCRHFSVLFSFLLLLHPQTAKAACSFMPVPFEMQLEQAEAVFIGTVEKIENKTVYFRVETPLRVVEEESISFATPLNQDTCAIKFITGQSWLFMGTDQMSGSQLIVDEHGRVIKENADFVKEKFDYDYRHRALTEKADLSAVCTSSGTPAFTLNLHNGVAATVQAPLVSLKDIDDITSFVTTEEKEVSPITITACDMITTPVKKGKTAPEKTCTNIKGTVFIGPLVTGETEGSVEWQDAETGETIRHTFHATVKNASIDCPGE